MGLIRSAHIGGQTGLAANAPRMLGGSSDGSLLNLIFTQDYYRSNGAAYALANLPGWSFTRASTRWLANSAGVYISAASGQPGISDLGLIIEEARTTLTPKSRRLDDAVWTRSNMSTSAAQGVDLVLGSCTRLTATGANATAKGATTVLASGAQRLSPFIRRVAGTGNIDISLDGGTTWNTQSITSSFLRYDLGQTVANPQVAFRIVSSGDSIDVDFGGGETGAFATTPMESLASVFTRAADVASIGGLSIASPVTLLVQASKPALAGNNQGLAQLDDGTNGNALRLYYDNATGGFQPLVRSGGSTTFTGTAVAGTANAVTKLALSVATGSQFGSVAGNIATGSGTTPPGPLTTLNIGGLSGGFQGNAYIQRITLSAGQTAAAQLQAVTQ